MALNATLVVVASITSSLSHLFVGYCKLLLYHNFLSLNYADLQQDNQLLVAKRYTENAW
jgi:hypothetical protein